MRIWVVELWDEEIRRYVTTLGVGLTRDGGRRVLSKWAQANPDDRFRLVAYHPRPRKRQD